MVDYMGDLVEQRADDEQQENEEAETPNGDEDETTENNEEQANENEEEQEEKASSDDDVVTGSIAKDGEDGPEAVVDEDGIYEESPKIEETGDETSVEHEERNDPNSGVDDPTQDEEQVLS